MSTTATLDARAGGSRRGLLRHALWLLAIPILLVLIASQALRWGYGEQVLTRRLTAALGRPVEVGQFDLSLLSGVELAAKQVTVAEDPRFGSEYFLHAERLTAGIRWTALLAGRFEFDSLVLTRPSVNLVRTPEGQWNLENWLPWPVPGRASLPESASGLRLRSVRVEGGRINFKRGSDKHPFAVVGVDGAFRQDASGRWNIDARGFPMRAGVIVQEAGTIRVQGSIGGASARWRPADLAVAWDEGSLSDALRLLSGADHGVRGTVSIEGRVGSPAPGETGGPPEASEDAGRYRWDFEGVMRLAGIHRWDLPSRGQDPALNLTIEANWWPSLARAEVKHAVIQGPNTEIRAGGFAQWGSPPSSYRGESPPVSGEPDSDIRLISSGINLDDLFRWYASFHSEVAAGLAMEGNAGLDLQIRGWPPRVERLVVASDGARLRLPDSADAVGLAATALRYDASRRRIELDPSTILFGSPGALPRATLRLDAAVVPGVPGKLEWNLAGQAEDIRPVLQAASVLNLGPARDWTRAGWNLRGSAELTMRWMGMLFPLVSQGQGQVRLRNATLGLSSLSEPLELGDVQVEFAGDDRRITLHRLRALGGNWTGSLRRRGNAPWEIALAADSLDAAAFNALAPSAPSGLLQRLASGASQQPTLLDALEDFHARGRLTVRQLRLAALVFNEVSCSIALQTAAPWSMKLDNGSAGFFGGHMSGKFEARQQSETQASAPAYVADVRMQGVNLAALTAGMPRLRGLFSGSMSAAVRLAAAGGDGDSLLSSLTGDGQFEVRNGQTTLLDLPASVRAGQTARGSTAFLRAVGQFTIRERRLNVDDLQLFAQAARPSSPDWLVSGGVPLGSDPITLDFRLKGVSPGAGLTVGREVGLRGPLTALEFRAVTTPP